MKSKNHRLVALALAVGVSVLLTACASVTTGKFVPSREVNANRTMTTNYDQYTHNLKQPTGGSRFRIVSAEGGGVFGYRYY